MKFYPSSSGHLSSPPRNCRVVCLDRIFATEPYHRGTTIFYGYGLGLYGRVGPALCLAIAVGVFLVQIPLSVWWLGRFRFGPAEWAWRSLTYLKPQPLLAGRDFALTPAERAKP